VADLHLVDPKSNPYLSGRFAPVHREIDTTDLKIEGDLPTDLAGAYMRNGPNAKFPPLGSYTFPMEGDGMVHAVWLENGTARYKNRWVRTRGMEAEERAGKAIFGGIMTPAFVDQSLLGPDPDPGWPIKLDAFINIVRHGGRYLALEEGTPPYEVTAEIETIGRYDFAGALPDGICAHPKVDPRTGDFVSFRYDVVEPFLTWSVVAADGTVSTPATPVDGVDVGYMIHDFAITDRFLVLVVGPVVFDIDAMMSGGQVLKWAPERGTRIGLIARDGSRPTQWIDTDAFWVWHFANAYDDGDDVVIDFPMWSVPGFLVPGATVTGKYQRAVISPAAGTVAVTDLHDAASEFPRIDDRLVGARHRYVTVTRGSGRVGAAAEHDVLARIDLETGEWVEQDTGAAIGEVVFAPRTGGTDALDGYYLTYGTSLDDGHAALYVWDAAQFPSEPRARVVVPQRIPNGLHGNWFPAT
jgi:carotenoid cleavage dioxygenase-like enzyme